jgi:glycosyltransferase involved in cell wall biosynthesis
MRIAVYCDFFHPALGGTQDSAALLSRGLAARGHWLDLYVPAYGVDEYQRASAPVVELNLGPRAVIHRLPSLRCAEPVPRLAVPSPARMLLGAGRPDIVHSHTLFGLGLEALAYSRLHHIPIVATSHIAPRLHESYVSLRAVRALRSYMRWYYNRCDFVTAPASFVLDELGKGFTARHRTLSEAVDCELFAPTERGAHESLRRKLGLTGCAIIWAGRLAREKSVDQLIRALAVLLSTRPDATLVVAGRGPEEANLRGIAESLRVSHAVRFVGALGKVALAEYLAAADVFVSMSLHEVQSLSLLQAGACGLPCAIARSSATPEDDRRGDGIVMVAPGQVSDLARAVNELMSAPRERVELGIRARRYAEGFSLGCIAAQWEELFREVIARSRLRHGAASGRTTS